MKQITAQKGQVVKDVHYQEQKVIDAQTEIKTAGQELEEKSDASDGCGKPHRNNFGCPSSECRK
ncbi:MAG: hypothetical protein ACLRZG_10910 [Streptococcus sp.]